MKFTKMHGCGNDYVYVNCLEEKINNPNKVAKFISDRHFGIGSDGMICICPSDKADFRMAMYNSCLLYTSNEDKVKILEQIALNRNCKMKGNELDYEKASKIVLEAVSYTHLDVYKRQHLQNVHGNWL